MMKSKITKVAAVTLAATMAAMSFAACSGGSGSGADSGEANTDTSQTKFSIIGGQSALSPGYDDNEVLKKLQEEAGINTIL